MLLEESNYNVIFMETLIVYIKCFLSQQFKNEPKLNGKPFVWMRLWINQDDSARKNTKLQIWTHWTCLLWVKMLSKSFNFSTQVAIKEKSSLFSAKVAADFFLKWGDVIIRLFFLLYFRQQLLSLFSFFCLLLYSALYPMCTE